MPRRRPRIVAGVSAGPRARRPTRQLKPSPVGKLLGTPYDITLHELRIEYFFAADAATEAALRRLSEAGGSTR